ncbi:MAG: aminotransferase class V-fold PLP-dependent enzyme [Candidatus Acidiferrales bacterium]
MDFQSVREQFPALREKIFLDAACVSLAPRAAAQAIEGFLDMALMCHERSSTLHHIAMDDMRVSARKEIVRLIHAAENEIALVESTTHGLGIVAEALPLERGDRVLLCDLEFMQVAIPWCQKRDSDGVEIDVATHRSGEIRVEDVAARITPRTRVLAISAVQWSNGFRVDLKALSQLCRNAGVWLVLDAIQQLGAIPIDVRETPVNFLVCGGHKWLNAPFGQGFLYIDHAMLPQLKHPLGGYLSLEPPEGGWGDYFQTPSIKPVREYRFVDEARRFEAGGTANYPGAAGLAASVKFLNDLGPSRVAERIFGLTDHLIAGLLRTGAEVITPLARENRSGIITFSLGAPAKNIALMEYLLDRKVLVSVRYTSQVGGVRVSCHFFNSEADIDRLLELTGEFLRGREKRAAT